MRMNAQSDKNRAEHCKNVRLQKGDQKLDKENENDDADGNRGNGHASD